MADRVHDLIDGRAAGCLHQRVGKLHRVEHVEIEVHVDLCEAGSADAPAHAVGDEQVGRRETGDRRIADKQNLVAIEVAHSGEDDLIGAQAAREEADERVRPGTEQRSQHHAVEVRAR